MSEWSEDEDQLDPDERRWPMAPIDLLPRERWRWWEQLWSDVARARRPLPAAAGQRMVGAADPGRGAGRAGRLGRALRQRRMGRPARQARRCFTTSNVCGS